MTAFETPKFDIKLPADPDDSGPHILNVEVVRNNGSTRHVNVTVPAGFHTFVEQVLKRHSMEGISLYAEGLSSRVYIGVNYPTDSGSEDTDLWYYTKSAIPNWLEKAMR